MRYTWFALSAWQIVSNFGSFPSTPLPHMAKGACPDILAEASCCFTLSILAYADHHIDSMHSNPSKLRYDDWCANLELQGLSFQHYTAAAIMNPPPIGYILF